RRVTQTPSRRRHVREGGAVTPRVPQPQPVTSAGPGHSPVRCPLPPEGGDLMIALFRALAARVKALFAADAALEFEAEFLARAAARKAELLRQAGRYEEEGLGGIALHLRQLAEELSEQRPLAGVLPALGHLIGPDAADALLPDRPAGELPPAAKPPAV